MYSNKFVVCIKVNGKILRETKDLVHLPFGSEFSVLVKNLNSRRAKFTLDIDGTDVLEGTEIIVNGNDEVELKRFIRNGNMNEGNAFKFIERTAAIEDGPRGIKVDDGVVRVEFWFEQEAPVVTTTIHNDIWWQRYGYPYPYYYYPYNHYPIYTWTTTTGSPVSYTCGGTTANFYGSAGSSNSSFTATASNGSETLCSSGALGGNGSETLCSSGALGGNGSSTIHGMSMNAGSGQASVNAFVAQSDVASGSFVSQPGAKSIPTMDSFNDIGITVPGSKVEQKFQTVYGFNPEAVSHVIILRLAGTKGKVQIAAPITVKSKNKCTTCGHVNKANAKFCVECGTALELV